MHNVLLHIMCMIHEGNKQVFFFFQGQLASVNFVISIFSSASTLLGIWGLGIVYRSTRHKLPMFRVGLKFASFQLVLVFVNLQSFVISILAANGIPPCDGSRGPLLRGSSEYINSQYSLFYPRKV